MIKIISGRFLLHVYPGDTLITEMWLEGLRFFSLFFVFVLHRIELRKLLFLFTCLGNLETLKLCRVVYQVKVKERNRAVLSGFVEISHLTSSL